MIELIQAAEFRIVLQDCVVLSLILVAGIWGSWPERAAIAIWILCLEVPSIVYRQFLGNDVLLTSVDFYLAGADFAAGFAWIILALYANRNYTLWISGAQLLAIGAHVSRGLVESISPIGYLFMVIAPGWIQLFAMAIGFTRHILRTRKYGAYRDWRTTRPPAHLGPVESANRTLAGIADSAASQKGHDL